MRKKRTARSRRLRMRTLMACPCEKVLVVNEGKFGSGRGLESLSRSCVHALITTLHTNPPSSTPSHLQSVFTSPSLPSTSIYPKPILSSSHISPAQQHAPLQNTASPHPQTLLILRLRLPTIRRPHPRTTPLHIQKRYYRDTDCWICYFNMYVKLPTMLTLIELRFPRRSNDV